MAIPRFDYPDTLSPTSSLVFAQGGRLVNDTPSLEPVQALKRTRSGSPRVESYGSCRRVYPFTARFLITSPAGEGHETDYPDVLTFIDDVIQGAVNHFIWTDEYSVEHEVIMVNSLYEFPRYSLTCISCVFQLEEIG